MRGGDSSDVPRGICSHKRVLGGLTVLNRGIFPWPGHRATAAWRTRAPRLVTREDIEHSEVSTRLVGSSWIGYLRFVCVLSLQTAKGFGWQRATEPESQLRTK